MQYSRDPLLETIFDRINDLQEPAFIKNSEQHFIAVNAAFSALFGIAAFADLPDLADKERACLVFGEDQTARYVNAERQINRIVDIERFTLNDGQMFLFGQFSSPLASLGPDTTLRSDFLTNMLAEIRMPMNGILEMTELLSQTPLDAHQRALLESIEKSGQALMSLIDDTLDLPKLDIDKNPVSPSLAGARILVVEDYVELRDKIVGDIESWGFECVGAPDAEFAISLLQAAAESGLSVDAILIDDNLQGSTGQHLLQTIRQLPDFASLSAILMTSGISDYSATVADATIAKPVHASLLRATLIDLILAKREGGEQNIETVSADRIPSRDTHQNTFANYVLVAEDNEVNQIFFSQILESARIPFHLVEHGQAALQAWQTSRPAVILMDVTLPDIDGFTIAQEIRESESSMGGRTPIIGVINHRHDVDRMRAISSGMDDFITKPMTPEQVQEKLAQWCGQAFRPARQQEYAR